MKSIKQRFEENYLLGGIKYNGVVNFYLMPLAWWILNYKEYDPEIDIRKSQFIFRHNIYNVLDEEIPHFMKCIENDMLATDELVETLPQVKKDFTPMYFFVDFDNKVLTSAFADIEVECYLPTNDWRGEYGNPIYKLPNQLQSLFNVN